MAGRKSEAVWYDSQQRWQVKVQAQGERRTFTCSTPGRKGKIAAEKKADAWLEHQLVGEGTRCDVLLDKYFAHLQASTSKAHWRQQRNYIEKYMRPLIGPKRIGRISESDLQQILDEAAATGLAKKTLSNLRACCVSYIKFCRVEHCTKLMPENLTVSKAAKKSKKSVLPSEDLLALFTSETTTWRNKDVQDWYIHAYRLAVLIGLRPGELLGLRWSDINRRTDTLTIQRALNDDDEITEGKNENAARSIVLAGLAKIELEAQRKQLVEAGIPLRWIFPSPQAQPTKQHTYRRSWDRYKARNGMAQKTTPYELRHTYVSVCDEMPEGLKKKVLGHSENMDTEGVYGHIKDGDLERAASYSDAAFRSILEKLAAKK